eukprot:COSAG02_NODE_9383_length_2235_cov_1.597378_1_plen_187_part_00
MSTFASRSLVFSSTIFAVTVYLHANGAQLTAACSSVQAYVPPRSKARASVRMHQTRRPGRRSGALCPGAELAFAITCDIGHVLQNPFHQLRRRQQASKRRRPVCGVNQQKLGAEERRQRALRTVWRRRAPMFSTVVFTSAETAAATTEPNALLSAAVALLCASHHYGGCIVLRGGLRGCSRTHQSS